MVRDETCWIAGPMKTMKSGVTVDLAASLAAPFGGTITPHFLNHFPCEPVRHVLLFSAESGQWVTLQRLDQVVDSKPWQLAHGRRPPRETPRR